MLLVQGMQGCTEAGVLGEALAVVLVCPPGLEAVVCHFAGGQG